MLGVLNEFSVGAGLWPGLRTISGRCAGLTKGHDHTIISDVYANLGKLANHSKGKASELDLNTSFESTQGQKA